MTRFWSVARAQHQQHRLIQLLVSRWQGKTSQVVSENRSVAGVLESDGAQPVPGARRGPSHRSNEGDSLVPPHGPLVPPHGQRLTRDAISCVRAYVRIGSMTR
jgi:hypothetical protein